MRYWNKDDLNDTKPEAFLKVQPDRVAFNEKAKIYSFLEFARPMDSRDGSSEQPNCYTGADWTLDWAQEKDLRRMLDMPATLVYLLAITEKGGKMDYSSTQLHGRYQRLRNRGSLGGQTHEIRGRPKKNPHVAILRQAIRKIPELSDVILRQFHVATHMSPEWAQHALADDISNTTTERFNFESQKKVHGPNGWAPIGKKSNPERLASYGILLPLPLPILLHVIDRLSPP